MRMWVVFKKTLKEQFRNPLVPILSVAVAPFFVLLIWMFFPSGGSTTYPVIVVNADQGEAADLAARAIEDHAYGDGSPIFEVSPLPDRASAESAIGDRKAVAFIVFPSTFTESLSGTEPVPVTIGGDLRSPSYAVAAIMLSDAVDRFVQDQTGREPVLALTELPAGNSAARSEFELYVPGILVFAIGMTIFAAAMTAASEVEGRTLHRLALTPVKSLDLLGGITLVQLLLGLISAALALVTAVALGFRLTGQWWLMFPIWALTSLGVIGLGLVTASLTNSVSQAFILANFPFGIFMFLAGAMFPVRGATVFEVGGQPINILDILPPRHAVNALSKIFTYETPNITYELTTLAILSAAFFALGVWLFKHRHINTRAYSK